MNWPSLFAAPAWVIPGLVVMVVGWIALLWAYSRAGSVSSGVKFGLAICKAAGIALLAVCLMEPVVVRQKPKRDANLFLVMADQSQSMGVHDRSLNDSRIAELNRMLEPTNNWWASLDESFDVRRYVFGERVESVEAFPTLEPVDTRTSLVSALETLANRYQGRSIGGILLLTDGVATGAALNGLDWSSMPPIYPIVIGGDDPNRDIRVSHVSVSQTNFEAAPVTIHAEIVTSGFEGRSIVTQLVNHEGNEIERQTVTNVRDGRRFAVRFEVRPESPGISFYTVECFEDGAEKQIERGDDFAGEATLLNNRRIVAVNRGQGPYRILYVCGRPNWELKFLKRAIDEDDEIDLVSLVRIAKREPKFSFRGRVGETTNPLFRGFGNDRDEQAEQYDEPVLLRLGTADEEELRDGFPKDEAELYRYHAIILDDLESDYFTQDQKTLIHQFVSMRGGSLLMLGGRESFVKGGYDRTPVGEVLPIYLDDTRLPPPSDTYQIKLTRDGWLQPWVRVRPTEQQENQRIEAMPPFKTVNRVDSIKPGAHVLARVADAQGDEYPALVVQKFGKGRAAAWTIGDLWRWKLHDEGTDDLSKSWRQTARWLVADVPSRVAMELEKADDPLGTVMIEIQVRDEQFLPMDNAKVKLSVVRPDNSEIELAVESSENQSGHYSSKLVPLEQGGYRAKVTVESPDGTAIGSQEIGWSTETQQREFDNLDPNVELLNTIAERSGGQVVKPSRLNRFVNSIPNHPAMITEKRITPWWHHWIILSSILGLLVIEWGVRRWKGLP